MSCQNSKIISIINQNTTALLKYFLYLFWKLRVKGCQPWQGYRVTGLEPATLRSKTLQNIEVEEDQASNEELV